MTKERVDEPTAIVSPIIVLGEIKDDGAIWTTCGWSQLGPAWVIESQIAPTVGYGWRRTGKTAQFQGYTLIELRRLSAPQEPVDDDGLVKEIRLCVDGLGALTEAEKQQMESATGYSAKAIAYLFAKALAEIAALKHDLERQTTIANIECNEAETLRRILRVARPYISDKAGAGIVSAIDAALALQTEWEG